MNRMASNPYSFQLKTFKYLKNAIGRTQYGKRYAFGSIETMDDFRRKVPIVTYEDIFSDISIALQGKESILWPGKVEWFAKSSGTTNDKSKFIPITKSNLVECHFRGGKDLVGMYLSQKMDSKMFVGKSLVLGGSITTSEHSNGVKSGDLSAVIMANLPQWAQDHRVPSLKTALMSNWEQKIEKLIDESINENITNIAGVPTWTLLLLRRVLERSGKETIQDVWPNLEFYTHGGVSFSPYKSQFEDLFGKDVNYIETYNASEGFFGFQDNLTKNDLLLHVDNGVYYEFAELGAGSWEDKIVPLEEVKVEKNYALIITTNSGLCRYLIGDTIKFTTTNPFKFVVTGRTRSFINAFGEELIVDNAENALESACAKTGSKIREYTAAPIYLRSGQKGRHEWFIEFENEPNDIEVFNKELDSRLREINSDYDAKRSGDLALVEPRIHVCPEGTFYQWMAERGKLGGQNKVPRLANDRKYADELIVLLHRLQS